MKHSPDAIMYWATIAPSVEAQITESWQYNLIRELVQSAYDAGVNRTILTFDNFSHLG